MKNLSCTNFVWICLNAHCNSDDLKQKVTSSKLHHHYHYHHHLHHHHHHRRRRCRHYHDHALRRLTPWLCRSWSVCDSQIDFFLAIIDLFRFTFQISYSSYYLFFFDRYWIIIMACISLQQYVIVSVRGVDRFSSQCIHNSLYGYVHRGKHKFICSVQSQVFVRSTLFCIQAFKATPNVQIPATCVHRRRRKCHLLHGNQKYHDWWRR